MINFLILNTNYEVIYVLDVYDSFIWTDRYNSYGDFEFETPMHADLLNYIKEDYYIYCDKSEHMMIIETIEIETNPEDGDKLKVSGRSLESILDRRICWSRMKLTSSDLVYDTIRSLIRTNFINSSDATRNMNFLLSNSTDPYILSATMPIDVEYTRADNVYDIVESLCKHHNIGFKVLLDLNPSASSYKNFYINLYNGVDRSYNQTDRPCVIFSPNFDNLISSNYIESCGESYKNYIMVIGEENANGVQVTAGMWKNIYVADKPSGLMRREVSRNLNVSIRDSEGEYYSSSVYTNMLAAKGREELINNYKKIKSFEGEIESTILFKYGVDFKCGDIVQLRDAYGHDSRVRVIETVISCGNDGESYYPTLESVD